MKIDLYVVGKIKDKNLDALIKEYLKRLSGYVVINMIEVADEAMSNDPSDFEIKKAIENEGKRLLKRIPSNSHIILFDLVKKQMTSPEFAKYLDNKLANFGGHLGFVIGGSYGLSEEIRARANDRITLSYMTFTHQMTRLIALEQIYRAFKINHNEVYHK